MSQFSLLDTSNAPSLVDTLRSETRIFNQYLAFRSSATHDENKYRETINKFTSTITYGLNTNSNIGLHFVKDSRNGAIWIEILTDISAAFLRFVGCVPGKIVLPINFISGSCLFAHPSIYGLQRDGSKISLTNVSSRFDKQIIDFEINLQQTLYIKVPIVFGLISQGQNTTYIYSMHINII